ncbi:MAG: hypothetical protein PHC54_05420 [Candidatus Omnitrophica bacterium]|nr:hypothetical protein [Candidatus Omnitrophota bacterium]MDD5592660.1 hypothetical protein [Candidatus Omnitrophota bacterium]
MGSWIERREQWIPHSKRRERRIITKQPETQIVSIADSKKINYNNSYAKGVIFILPKCPVCGNKKIRCYGTEGDTRYYKCKCGAKFKAFERNNINEAQ